MSLGTSADTMNIALSFHRTLVELSQFSQA